MLTLNLNESFVNMTEEQKIRFRDFMVRLFDDREILQYFEDKFSPENPLANIASVEVKWRPEVGPSQGKLHVHALVAIEHHGFFSFKANKLREDCRKYFGHAVYLQCPISSNARTKWLNYINK